MLFERTHWTPADLLFFVHVRKTAGTSVRAMFEAAFGPENCRQLPMQAMESRQTGWRRAHEIVRREAMLRRDNLAQEARRLLGLPNASLRTAAWVGGHVRLGRIRPRGRRVLHLTMLREPVARFVSEFRMVRAGRERYRANGRGDPRKRLAFAEDFEHYAGMTLERADEIPLNAQCLYFAAEPRFEPARRAIDSQLFLAGVTERFDDFFALLGPRLGVSFGPAARENVRRGGREPADLSPGTAARLRDALGEDIALHAHVAREFDALFARHAGAAAGGGR